MKTAIVALLATTSALTIRGDPPKKPPAGGDEMLPRWGVRYPAIPKPKPPTINEARPSNPCNPEGPLGPCNGDS